MAKSFEELTEFLRELGTNKVSHTKTTFMAHLVAVYRDLKAWGCEEPLCRAGMFHSIYGTVSFQDFAVPLERRAEIRELIGERAEHLAYLNCAMDYESFDRAVGQREGPYRMLNRFTGEEIELAPNDFEDLCRLHLCDWLEQVERCERWSKRREAYRQMAVRLEGIAQESYDRVFSREPTRPVA